MQVAAARAAAAEWVARHAAREPWFIGAYIVGSTATLPGDADLPPASDLDVFIVSAGGEALARPGKFVYGGALLEVTYQAWEGLASAEGVLAHYHLAAGLCEDTILADPTGRLRTVQAEVARRFAEERWVRRRCEDALQRSKAILAGAGAPTAWHDQVTSWLFGNGVMTHVLLVAALRNPTVRLRYFRARDVLVAYGHGDLYPELLGLLGCAGLTPQRAAEHLVALGRTFDAAAAALRTPYRFGSDITPAARPIAIDGSAELIRAGCHRETVFWIAATFARCHAVLALDAPDTRRDLAPAFEALLTDLGITSRAGLLRRVEAAIQFLPRLWETAEAIMDANPGITTRGKVDRR